MKIVFIASRSLENIGGIETYMKNLCPRLVEFGHEVILYSEGKGNIWNYDGVKVITLKSIKSKYLNKIWIGLKATIHAMKYNGNADIYHYNAMAAGLSSFLPILLNKTVVFQGHGFEWQRAKWSNYSRLIIKFLDYFVLKINRNITMVSEEQSRYVQRKFNRKSLTITPGINIPSKIESSSEIFERYSIKKGDYFLYLGRLVPEKKADILILAFLQSGIKTKQLIIAGDAPNEKKYIKKLKNLTKNTDDIIFTGAVYGKEKELLLQECYAFCIPSELEGLPITLLEAMSYKKVCIASDIKPNKEALLNTGLFFQVNNIDALSNMLKYCISLREEERISFGLAAFERVQNHFTWDKITNQYNNYINKIVKGV